MAGKGMLAEKSGDWLYLLELDVYYVSLLINWKLGTSSDLSERDGSGRLHNVYIYTAQVRPFVSKGCVLCYIHICNVGVGDVLLLLTCVLLCMAVPKPSIVRT